MNKFFTWISNLGSIAKVLPLVFAIAGAVIWYNGMVIKRYNEKNNDKALTEKVQTVIIQNDSLFKMFDRMKSEQVSFNSDVIEKLNEVSGTVGVMKSQLGQHIVRTATKEDIINWMQAFEKKKQQMERRKHIIDSVQMKLDTMKLNIKIRKIKVKRVSRYDQIHVSEDIAKGMNLNINDLTFIKRVFDLQDAANEEQNEKLVKEVAEVIAPIHAKLEKMEVSIGKIEDSIIGILDLINKINIRLDSIEVVTDEHTKIIDRLVRTQKWWNIALRILIAVALSVIISFVIHANLG